ncbi:MAG: hypothetical protein ACM33T_02860 [Solirubrobacterales bacterium]
MARRRNRRDQYGWRIWGKLFKLSLFLGAVGASGFYGFEAGQRLGAEEAGTLRGEVESLTAAAASHRDEVAQLKAELDATRGRADEFEKKYLAVAPSDDTKEILAAVRAKLDQGLDAKRLAFVVQSAEKPKRCGAEESKRFMVKTARFDGASTWVRFHDLVTVSAEGTGGNNGAEQWFDPEKPVTVKFTVIGGKEMQASGKLPLQHSMVVKGGEYRFTVAPGARGFVEVTGDRCEYRN